MKRKRTRRAFTREQALLYREEIPIGEDGERYSSMEEPVERLEHPHQILSAHLDHAYYQALQEQHANLIEHHRGMMGHHRALMEHHQTVQALFLSAQDATLSMQEHHQALDSYHREIQRHRDMIEDHYRMLDEHSHLLAAMHAGHSHDQERPRPL